MAVSMIFSYQLLWSLLGKLLKCTTIQVEPISKMITYTGDIIKMIRTAFVESFAFSCLMKRLPVERQYELSETEAE